VTTRRAFVTSTIALAGVPAWAARRGPPPKAAFIHWQGPGHALHGFMAIPDKAHGRQPAVLVLGQSDEYARAIAIWVATVGFVACWPKSLDTVDLLATIDWLATNTYGTGKVAAMLLGAGGDRLSALAPSLACAIMIGVPGADARLPILRIDRLATDAPHDYAQVKAFLKEHLG